MSWVLATLPGLLAYQAGVLGEGSFGKVVMVRTKVEGNDKPMALKIMAKSHIIESDQQIQVMREKQALMSMPLHPFIVELYGTYQVQYLAHRLWFIEFSYPLTRPLYCISIG